MNRLLKKPLLKNLSFSPLIAHRTPPKRQQGRRLNHHLLQSVLMMATVGGLLFPEQALAASLVWSEVVWPAGSLTQTYTVPTANGGSVNVRLTWADPAGTAPRIDNDFATSVVTGGFPNPGPNANSLLSTFEPDTVSDEITLTIEFLDGDNNPVPAENVNFTIFDIDRDDTSTWQDVVTVNGSLGNNTVSPILSTLPESVTVSVAGNVATGIFPPPPAPANQEADNTTGEGNLLVAYPTGVDTLTYTYGNGPESPSNPFRHGIALFDINFDPSIIGLAKSAGTPVQNSDGSFTVPYTLTVENLGETLLTNVQITEDLTTTFANANGFTVSNVQSANLTENTAFNGSTNNNLLQGGDTLAPGEVQTVTFDVAITPGNPDIGGLGPFNNNAIATATTPSGAPVNDESADDPNVPPGSPGNPDPNGNGDPIENTSTVVNLPGIGVAKQVADVADNGNNIFDVTYELLVENLGNVPLENVQVTEDLSETFADAATFNVTSVTTGGAPLNANSNFNGTTDQNLLVGTDTLDIGASQTITFVVRVDTGGNRGPYDNTALASGSNNGVTVTDPSDDGVDPDPNPNDGNPGGGPGENDPTQISLPDTVPIIGVAKQVTNVVDNGNNNFVITYELVVENLGPVPLENVQVTENLTETFAEPASFVVTSITTGGAPLTANDSFDGSTDQNLLVGTDTLAVGASQTITFVVNVNTGGNRGPFDNQVEASGSSGGVTVTDQSDDGIDPDPNPNDGNPGGGPGENDPTSFTLPTIGVAKRVANVVDNGNDNFDVTYVLVVENLGSVPLENVQVTENLTDTFAEADSFNVTSITTGGAPLTANDSFDGSTDQNLLVGTDTLAVGESQTITFVVAVNTGGGQGSFENQVEASGSSGGVTVTDLSDDGLDPDPNPDDGNPGGGTGENDPTEVPLPPPDASLQLIKRITAAGPEDNLTDFTDQLVEDPPNPTFVGLTELPDLINSGEVVEYTIYFLNDGFVPTSNVEICDPIPPPTEFAPDSFAEGQGIQFDPPDDPTVITLTNADDGDIGRFLSPLTPSNACPENSAGDQGAVFVNVANIAPGEFGFVRFRTSIP